MQAKILTPEVRDFDRIVIRIHNHICKLDLSQSEAESLQVRGPAKLLDRLTAEVRDRQLNIELGGSLSEWIGDALTTSLTRKSLDVTLSVRELTELDLGGFVQGAVSGLRLENFGLSFAGLGTLNMVGLDAKNLKATLKGSPFVELQGAVDQQQITISGMGQYRAGGLKSQKTSIHLSGSGFATIWAVHELDIVVQGMGSVEYYGQPNLRRRSTGMASLKALGTR